MLYKWCLFLHYCCATFCLNSFLSPWFFFFFGWKNWKNKKMLGGERKGILLLKTWFGGFFWGKFDCHESRFHKNEEIVEFARFQTLGLHLVGVAEILCSVFKHFSLYFRQGKFQYKFFQLTLLKTRGSSIKNVIQQGKLENVQLKIEFGALKLTFSEN